MTFTPRESLTIVSLLHKEWRNEGAATILALVKAVKFWDYLSFFLFDTRPESGASGSFAGQIKCLVINCKAILELKSQTLLL